MLITADDLLYFQRCRRRPFLEAYGDRHDREAGSGFLEKLHRDSSAHQERILADWGITPTQPIYTHGDWEAGAEATLDLMAAGTETIRRGVLRSAEIPGVDLVGWPHLLVKQPGRSVWGSWQYEPIDIRLGKKPKLEYQFLGAFYADLLAEIQGTAPDRAGVILRGRSPHWVDLRVRSKQMREALAQLLDSLAEDQPPELFVSRNRCSLCPWLNACTQVARQTGHLSLLPGVTPGRYQALRNLGITSLEQIAQAQPATLAQAPELEPVAAVLPIQAQASHQNQPILYVRSPRYRSLALPQSPIELYFDIEAEPDLDLDYLHGVLVVEPASAEPGSGPSSAHGIDRPTSHDHPTHRETFHSFLAKSPNQEAQIWQDLVTCFETYGDAPIYHFCEYEVEAFKRLAQRYSLPIARRDRILARFIDIHAWLTETVVLPIEGYALKQIAHYLGFRWRDPKANGAHAVYWYDRWLNTGDPAYLTAIVDYNEDDCRATYRVKAWLVDFWQSQATGAVPPTRPRRSTHSVI